MLRDVIETYRNLEEEYRLKSSQARKVEFFTTVETLEPYIYDKVKVFDCGCGVGIYSIHFAQKGAEITAIDLVPEHIERLQQIVKKRNISISAEVGNAIELSSYMSESYDVVLCLGPLYHLVTKEEQEKCLVECIRLTKPGGILALSYISPYSVFPCVIRGDLSRVSEELVEKIILENRVVSQDNCCFWTDNYYYDPEKIEKWLLGFELEIVDHVAADGQSIAFQNVVNELNENSFSIWMDYHRKTCRVRSMLGTSNHGLIIVRKKK